jgi:signal peptidase II
MKIVKNMSIKKAVLYTAIILGSIILDSLSKLLTVTFLKPVGSVPLIKGVLHFTYVENRGAAFGMLADSRWVFLVFSTLAIVAILFYLYTGRADTRLLAIGLSMIAGGGIGNMIDRLTLGYVVDFIDFALIDFAVFNIADSFVCVGAGLMVLALLIEIINEGKARS